MQTDDSARPHPSGNGDAARSIPITTEPIVPISSNGLFSFDLQNHVAKHLHASNTGTWANQWKVFKELFVLDPGEGALLTTNVLIQLEMED